MSSGLQVGLALMLEDDFLGAALPLFEEGNVAVLEWSFDTGWGREVPAWAQALLQQYSVRGALLGHGVSLSPLAARREETQRAWLQRAALEVSRLRYRHVSEHLGFLSSGALHRAAPMPMPLEPSVVRVGRDSLARLAETTGLPVGLENLAFALSARDVDAQGELIDALLDPVGGFLVLDLHNLWCQAVNFDRDPVALLERYPLERVRELHLAGGSWSQPPSAVRPFRRDTHDGPLPEELDALLSEALVRCPGVEAVIVERLGGTLRDAADAERLREDYRRVCRAVDETTGSVRPASIPPRRRSFLPELAAEVDGLARLQAALLESLARGDDVETLRACVGAHAPSLSALEWVAAIEPRCVEVGCELVREWGRAAAASPAETR